MLAYHLIQTAVTPTVARRIRRWLIRLGGIGFIPLGILDNSLIPLPGSMDLALIVLSARNEQPWPYYALMATVGSLVGGYLTYRVARRGGKKALESKFPRGVLDKAYESFEHWGFGAIAIPAVLPPPMPITPSLVAAGALQYPTKKFLFALTLGRTVRYTLLAFLSARYGRRILASLVRFKHPLPLIVITAVGISAMVLVYFVFGRRRSHA